MHCKTLNCHYEHKRFTRQGIKDLYQFIAFGKPKQILYTKWRTPKTIENRCNEYSLSATEEENL